MKHFFVTFAAVVAALFIVGLVKVLCLVGFLSGVAKGMDDTPEVKPGTILRLDLSQPIQDRAEGVSLRTARRLLASDDDELGLDLLRDNLLAAAADDRIAALFLTGDVCNADLALMTELREAIRNFKLADKPVFYWSCNTSSSALYVAGPADSIYIAPGGVVDIHGMSAQKLYYSELCEKVGIEFDVVKVGKYKSAIEAFTERGMSTADREQSRQMVESIWSQLRDSLAARAHCHPNLIDQYADSACYFGNGIAFIHRLIDNGIYYPDFRRSLQRLSGAATEEDVHLLDIAGYVPSEAARLAGGGQGKSCDNEIAVLYAEGEIFEGRGGALDEGIFAEDFCETVHALRADSAVKAVVLRVNSPGGSALAADNIWCELLALQRVKPVVVSMGGYAASGGYYISCASDYIVCEPTTITGSIGVYGLIPNAQRLAKEVGVGFDQYSTTINPLSVPFRPLSERQKMMLQASVEKTYEVFSKIVGAGRQMQPGEVEELAEGRVWSGIDAHALGLVDQLGGLEEALEMAAELSQVDDYELAQYPEAEEDGRALLKALGLAARVKVCEALGFDCLCGSGSPYSDLCRGAQHWREVAAQGRPAVQAWCPWRCRP